MRARLIKGYQGNLAGSQVDWEPGVIELLVLRGIAERVEEKRMSGPPQNKAIHAGKNKGR